MFLLWTYSVGTHLPVRGLYLLLLLSQSLRVTLMLPPSFTISVTASCSCWPLTTVLPSHLVKNTIAEAVLLACFLNTLPSPPWQACALAIIHHIRFQLVVLTLRGLHISVSPLSVAVSYCIVLCSASNTRMTLCFSIFCINISLHSSSADSYLDTHRNIASQ